MGFPLCVYVCASVQMKCMYKDQSNRGHDICIEGQFYGDKCRHIHLGYSSGTLHIVTSSHMLSQGRALCCVQGTSHGES